MRADIGFYTLSTFTVFKNLMRPDDVLKFPEYLYISKNYFHPEWVSHAFILVLYVYQYGVYDILFMSVRMYACTTRCMVFVYTHLH